MFKKENPKNHFSRRICRRPVFGAPAAAKVPPIEVDRNLPKSLFYSTLASDKVRKSIRNSAIVCYVCAAITGVVAPNK